MNCPWRDAFATCAQVFLVLQILFKVLANDKMDPQIDIRLFYGCNGEYNLI